MICYSFLCDNCGIYLPSHFWSVELVYFDFQNDCWLIAYINNKNDREKKEGKKRGKRKGKKIMKR